MGTPLHRHTPHERERSRRYEGALRRSTLQTRPRRAMSVRLGTVALLASLVVVGCGNGQTTQLVSDDSRLDPTSTSSLDVAPAPTVVPPAEPPTDTAPAPEPVPAAEPAPS